MFIASGPLYTERLILRAFRDSDLDDIARFEARPDVIRYLYWVAEDREGLRERLTRRLAMDRIQAAGDAMMLAVERQDSGAVIGHVMLSWASTEHMQGEIGFVFDPEQQGRGFATEAAQVVLQIGYERLGLHRIVGRADARNTRSIALMTSLGMRREALFVQNEFVKGEWTDEAVFALLAAQWRAAHPELVGDGRTTR